jgi:hypothetical protein
MAVVVVVTPSSVPPVIITLDGLCAVTHDPIAVDVTPPPGAAPQHGSFFRGHVLDDVEVDDVAMLKAASSTLRHARDARRPWQRHPADPRHESGVLHPDPDTQHLCVGLGEAGILDVVQGAVAADSLLNRANIPSIQRHILHTESHMMAHVHLIGIVFKLPWPDLDLVAVEDKVVAGHRRRPVVWVLEPDQEWLGEVVGDGDVVLEHAERGGDGAHHGSQSIPRWLPLKPRICREREERRGLSVHLQRRRDHHEHLPRSREPLRWYGMTSSF